jgi:hypothetical protein
MPYGGGDFGLRRPTASKRRSLAALMPSYRPALWRFGDIACCIYQLKAAIP